MTKEIAVDHIKIIDRPGNCIKAICDVEIRLDSNGSIRACGFRVLQRGGKGFWVSPPSRQGKASWFDVIEIRGPLKRLVEEAILSEYERAKRTPRKQ